MVMCFAKESPNHALQRAVAGRCGCHRRVSWPPSPNLGRCLEEILPTPPAKNLAFPLLMLAAIVITGCATDNAQPWPPSGVRWWSLDDRLRAEILDPKAYLDGVSPGERTLEQWRIEGGLPP